MDGTPTETFNKGDVIFGRFDYIKLSSGSAQLYLCYQSAGAASSVTRQSDLVGWWKFDDSVAVSGAADSTSTGNVATCNAVTGLAGINNKSFAFGNGYRNVIVPGHASYPTASDFSIGMWVYWDSPSPATANQAICSTGGYSQATGNWCVRVDDISGASPTLNFFAQDGTTDILSSAYSQSISPTLNTWHHVMMVYTSSSNTVTLYWDGVDLGDATVTGDLEDQEANGLYVGVEKKPLAGSGGLHEWPWPGRIDDARFYDVALTDSDVGLCYGSGTGDW